MKTKCIYIDEDGMHCRMVDECPEGCDSNGMCELTGDEFPETVCSVFEVADGDDKEWLGEVDVDEYEPDEDDIDAFEQYGEFENDDICDEAEKVS